MRARLKDRNFPERGEIPAVGWNNNGHKHNNLNGQHRLWMLLKKEKGGLLLSVFTLLVSLRTVGY